jgi:hypothetical protein
MAIRVVQWGKSNVGHHALRGVLEPPDLERIGLLKASTVATRPDWGPCR